jgi:hypothetical protein
MTTPVIKTATASDAAPAIAVVVLAFGADPAASMNGTGSSYWAPFRWGRRRLSFRCSVHHGDETCMTAPEGRYSLTPGVGQISNQPLGGSRWLSSMIPCESS